MQIILYIFVKLISNAIQGYVVIIDDALSGL